ncbi:MAG: biotin/lipoyl-containing protein [Thermosphaera sp.]
MKTYTVTTKLGLKFDFTVEGKEGNSLLLKDPETGEVFRLRVVRNHGDRFIVDLNGVEYSVVINNGLFIEGEPVSIQSVRESSKIVKPSKDVKTASRVVGENLVQAPITGKIVELKVGLNDPVDENTIVALMESMKMIVEVKSHLKGVVENIYVKQGQAVKKGDPIIKVRKS